MISRRNARKYLRYIFDGQIFAPHLTEPPGQHAIEVAAQIRGEHRGPAVMIHGIMPRSGTVYLGELLRHHPELHAYPGGIWELPFLERTTDLEAAYVAGAMAGLIGTLLASGIVEWMLPFVYNVGFPGFRFSVFIWIFLGGLVILENIPEVSEEQREA